MKEHFFEIYKCLEGRADRLLHRRINLMKEAVGREHINLSERIRDILSTVAYREHICREEEKIAVSYLRSSYITGSHIFLASCHSKIIFLEEAPPNRELDFSPLFVDCEKDIQSLEEEVSLQFIRVSDGERETVRRWYLELIYIHFGAVLKAVIAPKDRGIPLLYGGYMEEQEQIGWI